MPHRSRLSQSISIPTVPLSPLGAGLLAEIADEERQNGRLSYTPTGTGQGIASQTFASTRFFYRTSSLYTSHSIKIYSLFQFGIYCRCEAGGYRCGAYRYHRLGFPKALLCNQQGLTT